MSLSVTDKLKQTRSLAFNILNGILKNVPEIKIDEEQLVIENYTITPLEENSDWALDKAIPIHGTNDTPPDVDIETLYVGKAIKCIHLLVQHLFQDELETLMEKYWYVE